MSFFLLMTRREAATRRRTIKIDVLQVVVLLSI